MTIPSSPLPLSNEEIGFLFVASYEGVPDVLRERIQRLLATIRADRAKLSAATEALEKALDGLNRISVSDRQNYCEHNIPTYDEDRPTWEIKVARETLASIAHLKEKSLPQDKARGGE